MSVYRVNKTRDFTVMGNTHLRDKNLSLKAVGLLSKMLSFNDGWQFSTRGLAALCKEGPDAILSALKELEENGYLVRHRGRDDKGRMVSTEFDIYEMPQAGLPHRDNPHRENPDVENPDVENPPRENPAQRNTMVLHRARTTSASYNHFTCRTYKKDGESCTGHYIRECVLDEVVLEDLRRVTAMARERPEEFAAYIGSKQSAEIQREIRRQEKELAAMRKQKAELDAIFKKLYEDSVLSRITTEQFQMLSSSYTEEQNQIAAGIPQKEADIQRLRETVSGTDGFLDKAKRYMDITELTPELLRLFIEKIVVHEKEVKWSKHAPQTVEIYYNGIGFIDKQHQDMESLQPLKTEEPRQAS